MATNARTLLLALLQAAEGEPLSAREAVSSAAVLGISENSVRVALVRLTAAGLIQATGRGAYRLGRKAAPLSAEVAAWRQAAQRVRDWDGGWIGVHTAALGRSDRVALRARQRAFQILGLRELDRGLFLRPDNLVGGVDAIRERLHALGLDTGAVVFRITELDDKRERAARGLWDGKALNAHYRDGRQLLDNWMAHADQLETEVAARESYLLGNEAIRSLVFDPLLPAPLVDVEARNAFVDSVIRYDRTGKTVWQKLRQRPAAGGETARNTARVH
ncbi:MAG: PaaX family transcriptional regulator C-terminal domain-containing protein [Pseudomonadota bacterium]